MTEANDPTLSQQPDAVPPPPPPTGAIPAQAYGSAPAPVPGAMPVGTVGKIRSTGTCILLTIVTLGIYSLVWYFKTHDEMKQHSGTGIGGAIALILGLFVGIAMPFLTAHEVGGLYQRRGQAEPVSAVTGLWVLLPIIGSIIWFVKTNGALNAYWRSLGAQG
jgi:uncharacterized protein DUF4234